MEYETNYNNSKPLSYYLKRFLLFFLCIVILIFVLLWGKSLFNPLYDRIFAENLNTMKEVATSYYTLERLPEKVGESDTITLQDMLDMKLLLAIKDKNGEMCDTQRSYVKVTKKETEYEMKVNLVCGDESDYIIVYMGCYDYCLNYICEKQEPKKPTTVAAGSGKPSSTNPTNPTKPTPTPSKPDPTPDKPKTTCTNKYKYLYQKQVSTAYSEWSDWSANKTYNPNNNNISWGKGEYVWNEKNGTQVKTNTRYVEDRTKPIIQTKYDKVINTYQKYVCSSYNYYIDSSTSTMYQTSDWVSSGTVSLTYKPKDTINKMYKYLGMDYDRCDATCTLNPVYKYQVYTRTTKSETRTEEQLRASCNVTKKTVKVLGPRSILVGYESNRIVDKTTTYLYHTKTRTKLTDGYNLTVWSWDKNDKSLIEQGYKYTGTNQAVKICTTK